MWPEHSIGFKPPPLENANHSHFPSLGAAMSKTLSFAAVHFGVAFMVGYLMTGSVWVGGALALVEPACNTVAFHFHEKVWRRLERRQQRATVVATAGVSWG
jgi:uncharacterized membrane protein